MQQRKKECDFKKIQFKYFSDNKCEKENQTHTKNFNGTFYDKAKNKFRPNNDCQEVDIDGQKKWSKWICDDEQMKFVLMKDPNPMTKPMNGTYECSAEDDCDDCVVMEYQWERCIKDDNMWMRVIGA